MDCRTAGLWTPIPSFLPTLSTLGARKLMCPHHDTHLSVSCLSTVATAWLPTILRALKMCPPSWWNQIQLTDCNFPQGWCAWERKYWGECVHPLNSGAAGTFPPAGLPSPLTSSWHYSSGPALHTMSLPPTFCRSSFCPLCNHPATNLSRLFRLGWEMVSSLGWSDHIKISTKSLLITLSWDQSPERFNFLFFMCWLPWLVSTFMWNCWLIFSISPLFELTPSLVSRGTFLCRGEI